MDIQPEREWRDAGVLIVAHGAETRPRALDDTEAHAARLRGLGWFAEVDTAFFAGGTRPGDAIARLSSQTVYVVPHFMGAGYFVQDALPAEIAPAADGRNIALCAPPSTHREFPALLAQLIAETADAAGLAKDACRVVLAAHGSEKNSASADHAAWVRGHIVGFAGAETGFLEQEPRLESVLRIGKANTIVAGLFAASGAHATDDVMSAIQGAASTDGDPAIVYTGAVGASERMTPLFAAQIAAADAAGGRVAGAC